MKSRSFKIAVILNGCGHQDGSEISEAVLALLALDQCGLFYQIFAPAEQSSLVMNHLSGKEVSGTKRHLLEEAARIARGNISPLSELRSSDFSGLVIPGGYGAAYHFSDLAKSGKDMQVDAVFSAVVKSFHAARKPIGAICVIPVLLAKIFGNETPKVLLSGGECEKTPISAFGAEERLTLPGEALADGHHRIVCTPAYMYGDSSLSDIYKGIFALVSQIKIWLLSECP